MCYHKRSLSIPSVSPSWPPRTHVDPQKLLNLNQGATQQKEALQLFQTCVFSHREKLHLNTPLPVKGNVLSKCNNIIYKGKLKRHSPKVELHLSVWLWTTKGEIHYCCQHVPCSEIHITMKHIICLQLNTASAVCVNELTHTCAQHTHTD